MACKVLERRFISLNKFVPSQHFVPYKALSSHYLLEFSAECNAVLIKKKKKLQHTMFCQCCWWCVIYIQGSSALHKYNAYNNNKWKYAFKLNQLSLNIHVNCCQLLTKHALWLWGVQVIGRQVCVQVYLASRCFTLETFANMYCAFQLYSCLLFLVLTLLLRWFSPFIY